MERYKAEKQMENTQEANSKLRITEDNMMAMSWVLTSVHENKVVRALNDPSSQSGREVLAQDIRSMMAEFVQYANASYGNMFNMGGSNAYTGPFTVVDTGGGIQKLFYNGVDMDTIFEDPLTKQLLTPDTKPLYDTASKKYVALDQDGNRVLVNPEDILFNPVTDKYEFADPGSYPGYSLMLAREVPMDKDIYFDVGLGILVTGPLEDPLVIGETAFKVSYSGPAVLGFGVDENGVSNNLYNVMFEIQRNIYGTDGEFDREEVEKWNTKLRKLMDGFRLNLTDIGVKTNFLDAMETSLKRTIDSHTEKIQQLMGIDDAEEATSQMMNDYVLKAVLQLGSRILPLSLMDFVR